MRRHEGGEAQRQQVNLSLKEPWTHGGNDAEQHHDDQDRMAHRRGRHINRMRHANDSLYALGGQTVGKPRALATPHQ
jgi:hypothetical protein